MNKMESSLHDKRSSNWSGNSPSLKADILVTAIDSFYISNEDLMTIDNFTILALVAIDIIPIIHRTTSTNKILLVFFCPFHILYLLTS